MPTASAAASATLTAQPPVIVSVVLSATASMAGLQVTTFSPPEVYTPRFVTTLTAPITSGLRPTVMSVAATQAVFGSGTFSVSVYDAGTDANPVNFEAFEVLGGGTSLNWTVITESGWSPIPHASGSTVIATVLTPRSITQPLVNHTTPLSTPDPHNIYLRKSNFGNRGDLVVGSGGSGQFLTLPAATDGQVLTTDSTRPVGLRWLPFSVTSVLQHVGDLVVGGVLGVVQRLGVGTIGQVLVVSQNAPTVGNPSTAPIVTAAGSGGSLVNGTSYDFAYAWQTANAATDGGITVNSPATTFTATVTGTVQVQAPACPTAGGSLIVYAAVHGGTLTQQAILAPASTTSPNVVLVSTASPSTPISTVNTTGGIGPNWRTLDSTDFSQTPTFTGEVTAPDFRATGMLGSTAQARFGGGTVNGPPTVGTWQAGDFVIDRTGRIQVCTQPGIPGVWSPGLATAWPASLSATATMYATALPQVFNPSGPTHSAGLVADPGPVFGLSRFLREDASWQIPSGGGSGGGGAGGAVVPIQTQTLTSSAITLSFNVPLGFKNVRLTWQARSDEAGQNQSFIVLRANGDATVANYGVGYAFAANGNTGAGGTYQATYSGALIGFCAAATSPAGYSSTGVTQIVDYAATTFHKKFRTINAHPRAATAADMQNMDLTSVWFNTAAITSFVLAINSGANFLAGSSFTLWGEADTAPVLLTSNSNLIQEIVLGAAQGSIQLQSLPQTFKDLRLTLSARGDYSGTSTTIYLQYNNDGGSNYEYDILYSSSSTSSGQNGPVTAGQICEIVTAGGPAGVADTAMLTIPNYTASTFQKASFCEFTLTRSTATTNNWTGISRHLWRNTAAITSITLIPTNGNFAAGTTVRLYGEPASAAGPSVGTGTRARISTNQAFSSGATQVITWDTEDIDADTQHFTTGGTITGTAAKAAGSPTLTGTSTAFTTDLNVGQVISVPGGATEQVVVIAIASNTSATVAPAFANSASGQVVTRLNSAFVFRQPGMWSIELGAYMAAVASGTVTVQIRLNGSTMIGQTDKAAINASAGYDLVIQRQFQQWDYVEVLLTQNSGNIVNLTADERTHLAIQSRPTVTVAIPYINIQDQKTLGTTGGSTATYTSAFLARTLNTVVNDSAGISSLASNQITLPPGTYRAHILVPGFGCDVFQGRLQNVTDSTTLLLGTSARAANADNTMNSSEITGRFVLTGAKTMEVQMRAQTSYANGLGSPASFATEVYTVAEIWKEG